MQSVGFQNFDIGIVDNPSIEDQGGFEFASGMDILSEPGVLKASSVMEAVTLGSGVSLSALPRFMTTSLDGTVSYFAVDDKILKQEVGGSLNAFLTSSRGTIDGLGIFNGYVWYVSGGALGRAVEVTGASQNDAYQVLDEDPDFFPMILQAGTLKVGAGRYVASVDEASAVTTQALKLPKHNWAFSLSNHFGDLIIGSLGKYNYGGSTPVPNQSTTFRWRGIVLATGSALPDYSFPSTLRGMNALITDAETLYAFPDKMHDIYVFDGARFIVYRRPNKNVVSSLKLNHESVFVYNDSIIYGGDSSSIPGIFQMRGGAICQAFIPVGLTPGSSIELQFGFVKVGYDNKPYIGFKNVTAGTYHIQRLAANKQNNSYMQTVWHRLDTDKFKRWRGVKLNLKTLAFGCSVAIAYRTEKNVAFTDSGYTITSANQNKPVIFAAQPRSREIQYKFTYTTNGANTPELLSYDPIFEALKTLR